MIAVLHQTGFQRIGVLLLIQSLSRESGRRNRPGSDHDNSEADNHDNSEADNPDNNDNSEADNLDNSEADNHDNSEADNHDNLPTIQQLPGFILPGKLYFCPFTLRNILKMTSSTPSIPSGTRDFLPEEMARRNYIFDIIRQVFHRYGFQPIETPAMENLSTLLGKYGEEGDRLIFRLLNSGDYLAKVTPELLQEKNSSAITPLIAEKGLRYDLTVPFARFVVQHRNDIVFPFRRYQIQPVWRADRPQKGRYREFYQCDCDVIGSDSLLNEAELVQIMDEVFSLFRIRTVIKVNNRKLLAGIAEVIGYPDRLTDITVAIDKMDKIGAEKVDEELTARGISPEAVARLQPILFLRGTTEEKISVLKESLSGSPTGLKGVEELETLFGYIGAFGLQNQAELDLTLARGLNYYTGAIFEVKALDDAIGSVCGGGRYDDLTGVFGMPGVSGVGVSFGAERIYDVMNRFSLFPEKNQLAVKVLFVNFGRKEEAYILPFLARVRQCGVNAEIYPEPGNLKKQMNYANRKGIPFVVIAGETEIQNRMCTLKNMTSGEQLTVSPEEMIKILSF